MPHPYALNIKTDWFAPELKVNYSVKDKEVPGVTRYTITDMIYIIRFISPEH